MSSSKPIKELEFRIECPTNTDGFFIYDLRISPVKVDIDIKPGSDPNPINLGSSGVVRVAILSPSYGVGGHFGRIHFFFGQVGTWGKGL